MVRIARMYVSSRVVASDVLQEAWLGVVKGIHRFEGRASLRTWMYRIVANIAKTEERRRAAAYRSPHTRRFVGIQRSELRRFRPETLD